MKIIFVGTGEFGAKILEKLAFSQFKPFLVITNVDKVAGRKKILTPPPVKIVAKKLNIPFWQTEKIKNLTFEIKKLKPDLILVASFGQILPKEILEIPKHGCLNIHPSLLPRWRGPSPIQYTILNGDEKTGVTIIKMTEKIDAGPIVAQKELSFYTKKEDYLTLHQKLSILSANLLLETLPKWIKGEILPRPQDEKKATYSKLLKKEDGKINWQNTAEQIERKVRAFNPWPGVFTFWEILKNTFVRIKVLKARVYKFPLEKSYPIGKVLVVPQNEIGVQCKKDFLVIEKLQMEGKKETFAEDFLRGHPDFIGTILK